MDTLEQKRAAKAAYMRAYYNDPAHPERREKKRAKDREYAIKNSEKAIEKMSN